MSRRLVAIVLLSSIAWGCASLKDVFDSGSTRPKNHAQEETVLSSDQFVWPVEGVVRSAFGKRGKSHHDGIDIFAKRGTPVVAADSGEVVYSGRMSGYGNLIIIRHPQSYFTVYAHNQKNWVKKGKRVKRGETKIASVGSSGNASGCHLHFEVRLNDKPRDPLFYLPKRDEGR